VAVYTHLGAEDLARLIAEYDAGRLVSAKGIAEGVSNSNWLIETTQARYILTMYERRIELADLPFFLALLDHLSEAADHRVRCTPSRWASESIAHTSLYSIPGMGRSAAVG